MCVTHLIYTENGEISRNYGLHNYTKTAALEKPMFTFLFL